MVHQAHGRVVNPPRRTLGDYVVHQGPRH